MTQDICCGVTAEEEKMLREVLNQWEKLLPQGGIMHFKKGHVLFYEGHNALGFYILKKGQMMLSRIAMDGKREPLQTFEGELFGLFHLLTNTPHCATATAKSDVEVFFVPKSVVLDFLKAHDEQRRDL